MPPRVRIASSRRSGPRGSTSSTGRWSLASRSSGPDKRTVPQIRDRLLDLLFGVHDDRPVPRDRLVDRLARDEQEADALLAGLDRDLVATIEQHERAVAGVVAAHLAVVGT